MNSTFKDKTLMITGGTGSFGNTVLKHFMNTDLAEILYADDTEPEKSDRQDEADPCGWSDPG